MEGKQVGVGAGICVGGTGGGVFCGGGSCV